jgi:L-lysine 2,3-aminomutase
MLQALRHEHALVNGYSGFFPARSDRLVDLLRRFPDVPSVRALRRIQTRYVVVDPAWSREHRVAFEEWSARGLSRVYASPEREVYALDPSSR